MHKSSIVNMENFIHKYLTDQFNQSNLKVLDVGSQEFDGTYDTYRELFKNHTYVGFDIVLGKNVDITDWNDIEDNSFDVVISGQTFEHAFDDVALIKQIARVLKPNCYCCIIAPSRGKQHCLPDYRRYCPNDFIVLAEQVNLKVIEAEIKSAGKWGDCVLIAYKEE